MFEWLLGSKTIDELIARKEYGKAVELARRQLEDEPGDRALRLKLADALTLTGDKKEAITILRRLSDDYAKGGFIPKAIALLKKIQKLDPSRSDVDERLADLVSSSSEESFSERLRRMERQEALKKAQAKPEPAPAPAEAQAEAVAEEEAAPSGVAKSPLFSDFSGPELLAVIRGLKLETFEPGEIIVAEGEPGDSLFVLTEGHVRVYVRNAARRNVQVREMEEGAFFGEISILAGKPRTATITSATPCELLELDRETLDRICEKQPRVRQVLEEFYEQRSGSAEEAEIRSRE